MRTGLPDLASQKCFNHALREAVARCPECGRFFCRECVTEHEERVVCARCLAKTAQSAASRPSRWRWMRVGALFLGIVVAWFFFYALGSALVSLPDSFHEGTFWQGASE